MAEMRRTFVETVGLRLSAADPADLVERGERGRGRGRVGRLAVVDEGDAVLFADALHAVGETGVGTEAFLDFAFADAKDTAGLHRSSCILRVVRTLERSPVRLVQTGVFRNTKHA